MGRPRAQTWPAAAMLLAALPVMPDGLTRDPEPDAPPARGDSCEQTEHVVHGARRTAPFTWVMNEGSIPDYLDRDGTVRAVGDATLTIALARTDCPPTTAPTPRLPAVIYAGPTERQANVTRDAKCFPERNTDGVNVVSFGPLPADVVAVACTYTEAGVIWQADVMLTDAPGTFTLEPEKACSGAYDLQAVMTHERGHSFGLAHVPEVAGSDALTMSVAMSRCDPSARFLGRGDVLGLAALY